MRISDWSSDVCSSDLLDAADTMLAAMAERLQAAIGDDAIAARFSEHSLAVLMRGNDYAQTTALAERIREAFSSHVFQIGNRSSVITASIGGVQIGEKIASVTQVLAKANQGRSEEHTSELQSLMRISYAVFCLK